MDKQQKPNGGARERMLTLNDGEQLFDELASAAAIEEVKVIDAKAKAAREIIASIGDQLRPFAPTATALAQAWQEQVQCNTRLQEAQQKNEQELRLRAAQDAETEKVRQSRVQARLQMIGLGVFGFIVLVAVAMTMLVHEGVLDKTSALTVGVFLPLLWGAIKNMGK